MSQDLVVTLPSDLVQWDKVKSLLEELRSSVTKCSSNKRTSLFLCYLYNTRRLILNPNYQPLDTPFYVKKGWYLGVGRFLEECISSEERDHFFECSLPSIIQLIINLDFYRPSFPLYYCIRQKEKVFSLPRGFIAALNGAAFLSIFPEHPPTLVENMNDYNFRNLFAEVNSDRPFQIGKLRCFLNYFDQVMMMTANQLEEFVTFKRAVSTKVLSHSTLMQANKALCSFRLNTTDSMDEASCQLTHINFANAYIGGGVLRKGATQEEIKFAECPELLISLLFMESLDDNEAVAMSGYRIFNEHSGYSTSFKFVGPVSHAKLWSKTPLLSAIDALPYYSWYKKDQYLRETLLREINKVVVGFSQQDISVEHKVHFKSSTRFDKNDSGSSGDSEVDEFADHLVHRAIDSAYDDITYARTGSYNLPVEILQSVRSLVTSSSSSSSGSGSTRSSLTSRSSRRGSSRRSSELSSSSNDEGVIVSGTGDIFRDPILEEEMSEEEEEDDDEEEKDTEECSAPVYGELKELYELTARMSAPPILLQAPISDASKLSISQEYLNSQGGSPSNLSPASPAMLSSARMAARRNSSPLLLGQRKFEQRRSSIPSHIRLLPLCDSAKMAANSCGFGLPRTGTSSESERLSVRSYRSYTSSCCGPTIDTENTSGLEVWADAFAQHSVRNALTEIDLRFCAAETVADQLSLSIMTSATAEVSERLKEEVPDQKIIEDFAEKMAKTIMDDSLSAVDDERKVYGAFARRMARRIVNKAVRRAARLPKEKTKHKMRKLEASLSTDDMREFESRLSLDADLPAPILDFPHSKYQAHGDERSPVELRYLDLVPRCALRRRLSRYSMTREDSFYDALDIPYWLVEDYAEHLSQDTMLSAELEVFRDISSSTAKGVVTGNWGCGSFNGDPQMKCLLQWIAASMCGTPILFYHTLGDTRLEKLPEIMVIVRREKLQVSDLYALIQDYCHVRQFWSSKKLWIFDFIQERLGR